MLLVARNLQLIGPETIMLHGLSFKLLLLISSIIILLVKLWLEQTSVVSLETLQN